MLCIFVNLISSIVILKIHIFLFLFLYLSWTKIKLPVIVFICTDDDQILSNKYLLTKVIHLYVKRYEQLNNIDLNGYMLLYYQLYIRNGFNNGYLNVYSNQNDEGPLTQIKMASKIIDHSDSIY